ncbi:MAG: putative lipid II flippase FtsW [Coriobacteriales bacterium]|jgi:cell division protein FtsW
MNERTDERERKGSGLIDRLVGRGTSASVLAPRLLLIGCVLVLIAIGLVMIYSASSIEAYEQYGEASYFLKRQAIMVLLGIAAAVVVIIVPFEKWNRNILLAIWGISMLLLILTEAFGFIGLGSKRWIYIGSFGFQPSELAKIAMILMSAYLIVEYHHREDMTFLQLFWRLFVVAVLPAVFILIQPDLGTTLVALVGVLAVLWFGEVKKQYVAVIIIAVLILAVLAVTLVGFRSDRISAWLDPWSDPLGTGYQTINSFYAFANGGIFGVGLGNSTQKYLYLPYAYNDFIFAVFGEEFGLVGCVILILLYLTFLLAAFRIGNTSTTLFGKIICDSFATTIVFQAFLNMGCVIGVFPVTGKPLPFISYGGSSLVTTMIMVGFILAVSFRNSADTATKKRRSIRVVASDRQEENGFSKTG